MMQTRNRWRDWLIQHDAIVFPIAVALITRLALAIFGAWAAQTPNIEPQLQYYSAGVVQLTPTGLDLLTAPFQRWDAIWYELIAGRGYLATDVSTVFFPLFPLLMRALALNRETVFLGAMIAAMLCTAASFILFYRITRRLFNRKTAQFGLIAWATFPTTFFLFIPYAEALFVLCAIFCLEAARQKKWLVAGITGGLGALTRSPGVWLALPLGIEWLSQAWTAEWKTRLQTFSPILLVPLGLGIYMGYLQLNFGDALLWVHALAAWHNAPSLPWDTMLKAVGAILFGDPDARIVNFLDFFTTVFILGMVVWGLLPVNLCALSLRGWTPRLPLIYGLYGLIFTLSPLTLIAHSNGLVLLPMASAARRASIIFPAFMVAGNVLQARFTMSFYLVLAFGFELISVFIFVRWWFLG